MSVLQKTHEFTQIEWKVVDIFADVEDENFKCFVSPTFSFADATWRLLLAGKFLSNPESTSLILMRNEHRNCSLEYTFGLKKLDGSVEQLDKGIMKDDQKRSEHRFIKLSEVLQRKSELAPKGIVTITCSLKLEASMSAESSMFDEPNPKKLRRLDTLSQNLKDVFTEKLHCDTVLRVKDKEYQAHKAILIARSRVFAAMFQHETSEKQTGVITIPDCDPDTFEQFLEFLYCGTLDELSNRNALHLYQISEKYEIMELKEFCCEHLIENLSVDNWYDIIVIADVHSEEALLAAAQDFFNKNLNEIFQTCEWEQLMRNNYVLASKLLKEIPKVKVEAE